MTTPDLMPILSSGAHPSPKEGACVMEYASLLAGEEWSDSPTCTHPVLAAVARHVNDSLGDDARQSLLPLLPRLMGTAETGTAAERHRLSVSLAVWCAERVVHLTGEAEPESRAAIRETRAWLDGEASKTAAAAHAAYTAAYDAYVFLASPAVPHLAALAAANAANAVAGPAYATTSAANAATHAGGGWPWFLSGLIDEYDRLTGRTQPAPLTPEDMRTLTEATA